jgi:hypothetical protein
MNDNDLIPEGATDLPRPVIIAGRTVATFTPTRHTDPAEAWTPFTRPTSMSSDGTQGDPYGSLLSALRPGQSIEHEPTDNAEKASQRAAQAASHMTAGQQVRAALRPSIA